MTWAASPHRMIGRPGAVGPAGVGEQGKGTAGFPGNVGDPDASTHGSRDRVGKETLTSHEAPSREGSKLKAQGWYRQAKETKCGGTGVRESQRPDSTCEAGERDPIEPRGGKRDVESWSC